MYTTQPGSNVSHPGGAGRGVPANAGPGAAEGANLHELAPINRLPVDQHNVRVREPVEAIDYVALARRALRGRYAAFILLGLVGAGLGAFAGWKLGKPDYRSTGIGRIAYVTPPAIQQTDQNMPLAMYDTYMRSQEKVVLSR